MKKKVIYVILIAVIAGGGYLFKDRIFTSSPVKSVPVCETEFLKSSITITSVTSDRVEYTINLEAKKNIEVFGLRAFYVEKTKTSTAGISGNYKRSKKKITSTELGSIELTEGNLEMKSGEKKSLSAFFTIAEIKNTHYIEIEGVSSEPCPAEMSIPDCIEKQFAAKEQNPEKYEIYLLERVRN